MGNILRILKRDLLRLAKTPSALVIVLALLVLPSMYAWYNVAGFWDPYGNTGNLRVCVVNEDAGGTLDLGTASNAAAASAANDSSSSEAAASTSGSPGAASTPDPANSPDAAPAPSTPAAPANSLNVGDQIIAEIQNNHELDWQVVDRETAMREVESGESYAAFIIPEQFTADLLTLTTGNFQQPSIEYYVNEKAGPVAPKITDAGATTLDETVNSLFVSTVARAIATELSDRADALQQAVGDSRSEASARLAEAAAALNDAESSLAGLSGEASTLSSKVEEAQKTLDQASGTMGEAAESLASLSGAAANAQSELASFSAMALPLAGAGIASVSSIVDEAHEAAGVVQEAAGTAQGSIAAAATQAREAANQNSAALEQLEQLAASLPAGPAADAAASLITALTEANTQAQAAADALDETSNQLAQANEQAQANSEALATAADEATAGMQQASDALFGDALSALGGSLANLSSASSQLSAAAGRQDALIGQASGVLDQLSSTLDTAQEALGQSGELAAALGNDLVTVQTDFAALGGSDAISSALESVDADKVAEFAGAPTELVTERLYATTSYGAAMAPLFMNLTFWIGAFMLMVILKLEVDDEGIPNLTLAQRYLGRFALFALFAVFQAIICCVGIAVLGVQPASFPALVFAACVTSLAYLSVIYALSVTLQHVGMGLCVALVFVQIPGATGLYPIEMTPSFFQFVYPLFPFTYGIGAMREAICGFYGTHYAQYLGVLALFLVAFLVLGVLLRPLMANVNRMVSREIKACGLYNGEDAEIPARRFRFSQIVRVLADREDYRARIEARRDRFMQWYPRIVVGCAAAGIAVPVVLAAVFALTPTEKVVLLTGWLALLVLLFVGLTVVESLRDSLDRQLRLGALSVDELQGLYAYRNRMGHGERAEDLVRAEAEGENSDEESEAGATENDRLEAGEAGVAETSAAKAPANSESESEGDGAEGGERA